MAVVLPITLRILHVNVACAACLEQARLPSIGMVQGWALSHRAPRILTIAYSLNGRVYLTRPTRG